MKQIKIGILRETRVPVDRRVPLSPSQVLEIEKKYPDVKVVVQPSTVRCYSDEEYKYLGIEMNDDVSNCDILLGIKEVDVSALIPNKTYLFFGHVAKGQEHNRNLLREMVRKNITFIDYEFLKSQVGQRLVAFGRWAGIVGAYNALMASGIRQDTFNLKPAYKCHDLDELWSGLKLVKLREGLKILITGEGRVAHGAIETLSHTGIRIISAKDFLYKKFKEPVVAMIGPRYYAKHKDGEDFSFLDFLKNKQNYESAFMPFAKECDILVACHFWEPGSPRFFTKEQMRNDDFNISVIADVSCDMDGAIPSTLRASTIEEPFYGYNPITEMEEFSFTNRDNITVMAVDNLPNELPRSGSKDFGESLLKHVIPTLITDFENPMITDATITHKGHLTNNYKYLSAFINKK
ncbi:MAG: NAD(P)-dependent oxidoreductase [Bacteroidales bacterium]|jgi:alanine dehydrogenase|nr:NAD(P)-dependent oxidoreductase [Bacteroidales bacterium]